MSMLLSCCCDGDLPLNNCFGCRRKPNVPAWLLSAAGEIQWNIPATTVSEESRTYPQVISTSGGPFGAATHWDVTRDLRYEQRFIAPTGLLNQIVLTEPSSSGPCVWWHRKISNAYGALRQGYWFVDGGTIGNPGPVVSAAPSAEILAGPTALTYPEEVYPHLILPTPPACPTGEPSIQGGAYTCGNAQYGWSVRLVLSPVDGLAKVLISSSMYFLFTSHTYVFDEVIDENRTLYGEFDAYNSGDFVERFVATIARASFTTSGIMTGEHPDGAFLYRPTLEYSGPFDCAKLSKTGHYNGPLVLEVSNIIDPGNNLTSHPDTITLTTV